MATAAVDPAGGASTTAVTPVGRKKPAPRRPAAAKAAPPRVVTDEDIRLRAYFLSIEHGGQGSPVDFWLLAERQLRGADPRRRD